MTRPAEQPRTYQQWLDCFAYLSAHPADREVLELAAGGQYPGKPAESFLVRLSDTVGTMLSFRCQQFLRQLDQALGDGEPDLAPLLAARLKKSLRLCLFYRSLPFLEERYVQELDRGFSVQLQNFWTNFLTQLKKIARDSDSPAMEDLLLEMSRIKIV